MGKSTITISGSFKGIAGGLIKKISYLIAFLIAYKILSSINTSLYLKNNISSVFAISIIEKPLLFVEGLLVIIGYVVLAILALVTFFKIFALLYNTLREVEINFVEEKITIKSYYFPFVKDVEEMKFDRIITVNVCQGIFDRLFNSGTINMEYLISGKVGSTKEEFEIPFISDVEKLSKELI